MEETDFHSMKRKQLQALCKQHNIRANSTNLEMANNLTQFFKEKEKQIIETIEVSTETESSNVFVSKKVKKVRFSPENELIEFTRTHKLKRSRRSVVLSKNSNLSVDNVNCEKELNGDSVDMPVRMRLKGKALLENVDNVGKRGRKEVMVDDIIENQVSVGKIEDITVGMQLRGKTLKDNVDNNGKRGRKRVIVDKIENQDGVGNDKNGVGNRRSLRSKEIVGDGNLAIDIAVKYNRKGKEEALDETHNLVRRSKRRVSTLVSSKLVVEDTKVGEHVTTKSKVETAVQNQENVNLELRRSRRKSVLPSREQAGSLEPEPGNEKVLKPGGVVRTSRRKALDPNPVSSMTETKEQLLKPCVIGKEDSFVQKSTRTLKRHATKSLEVSDEFEGDDIMQRKNEARKKKKVSFSKEDVVIDDSSNNTRSIIGVSDVRKPSSTMEESDFVEGSLQDGVVVEHRESLATQMSVPEVKSDFKQKHMSKRAGAAKLKEIQDKYIVTSTVMDENEQSGMKVLTCEKDFPEMVAEKAHLSLDAGVQVSKEENIIVADNDDVAAQITSDAEISTFHANSKELTDNSNVCVNVISAENSSLAETSSFGGQTDVNKAESDECGQPISQVLGFVSDDKSVSAEENVDPVVPVFINDVSLPLGGGQGTDMELLVATSPCQDMEQTHTEYDLNDVNCLKESNISADQNTEDTAEKPGDTETSGGFDTLFGQRQTNVKNGVAENEPSRTKDLTCEKDFSEIVVEKAHLSLEADVQVSNEENIIVVDNDDVAAQMISHAEISTIHANREELTDSSNVCANVISAESSLLADASSLGDQTDVKSDLEFVEAEADGCGELSSHVLGFVSEDKGVSAEENTDLVVPVSDVSLPLGGGQGTGKELLFAPNPCQDTEYDLNDVNCLKESNICADQSNEDTAEKSGAPKKSGRFDTLFDQCQTNVKNGVGETSREKLIVNNISGDNMFMEKTTMDGEHEAIQKVEEISNYTYEPATPADNQNSSKENEDSIEAQNADVESFCDTVITELKLGRRLSEGNFQDIMVTENQNGQIRKEDIITSNKPNEEDSCQGTNMSNLEASLNKPTITRGVCSSIQYEELNMDGEKESERENSINKSSLFEQEGNDSPDKFEASSFIKEASGFESILESKTCDEDFCSVKDNIVIENKELHKDGEKECEKPLTESPVSEREEHDLQSLFATPIKSVDTCMVDGASGSESILKATSAQEDVCTMKENVVIATMTNDRIESGRAMEFEKVVTESLVFESTCHVLDVGSIAGTDETDLRLLFATPNKTEASDKVNGYCRSASKLKESCFEKVCSAKQQESHDKVAESGYLKAFNTECSAGNDESDLQLLFATPNKIEFSCEANQIRGSESKNALGECTVENVCPMKQNTPHEEVEVAGLELTNNLSPVAPNTEVLVNNHFLDSLPCATDSPVNCGEEHAHSSGNLDTGSQNQSQDSVATLCDNLNCSGEKEQSVDERTADVEECIDYAIEKLEVTSLSEEWKFDDSVAAEIQDQELLGCNIMTNIGGKLSEEELGQNGQESDFLWLFSTPNKSEAPCEANATRGSETELRESCMEKASSTDQKASCQKVGDALSDHGVLKAEASCEANATRGSETKLQESCMEKTSSTEQKATCEKVGDAISDHEVLKADFIAEQYEIDLPLLFATPSKLEAFCASECKLDESCMKKVAPNNENMKDEDLNLVNGLEVANLDSSTVLPMAFEASKENWTGETFELKKGTSSLSVEHILSSGQPHLAHLVEESKDDDKDSAEIISTMPSPLKNRNESCDKKLLDIESPENLKLAQSSDLRSGFANGDTIQKCTNIPKNNDFAAYSQGRIVKKITSTDVFLEPSSLEMANDESGIDVVTDKETGTTFLDEEPLFSNLEMHLLSGDNDYESSNCSHKEGKDILGSSTDEIVNKLSVSELHFENETDSRFEVLKESEVMETIQEYTSYESSSSINIDCSDVTDPVKASTEASKISYPVDEPSKDSILDEVFALRRISTAKKAARTILIHGTPNKALATADMKENDPLQKQPLIGNITIARPAKRRALQDIDSK